MSIEKLKTLKSTPSDASVKSAGAPSDMSNRMDGTFHDVDPITHRPFSAGHPDGVWMIAILFGFAAVFACAPALFGLIGALQGAPLKIESFGPLLVSVVLFVPAIILLFRRSKAAYYWLTGLAALAIAVAGAVLFGPMQKTASPMASFGALAGAVFFVGLAYYARGLRRDRLLN